MATTLTRYLKLKVADDLSADSKYNLSQIDSLGATFVLDSTNQLNIKSVGNITIEPESPDVGGAGNNSGTLTIGDSSNKTEVIIHSTFFRLRSALSLLNQAATATNYLSVSFNNANELVSPQSLVVDVGTGNRTISFPEDGEVVTTTATQTLTNKAITGIFTGPLTGNVTGNLTGDVTGNVTGNLTGDVTGNASTATDLDTGSILGIAKGGTGQGTATAAIAALLPSYTGNALSTLRVNATENGIEWAVGAGLGTVTSIGMTVPTEFSVSPSSITTNGTFTISKVAQSANTVYIAPNGTSGEPTFRSLIEADIPTLSQSKISSLTSDLAGKEPTLSPAPIDPALKYWRGDKSWQTLDKSAVGLSNVDNTSDANKPISSATQTALNAKYDASNPSSYIDAAGARSAVVVNAPTWAETTYAPSAAAVASYVGSYTGGTYAANWTTGTSIALTHALNSNDITVNVYDIDSKEELLVDIVDRTTVNEVTLTASSAPTGSGWRVVIRK